MFCAKLCYANLDMAILRRVRVNVLVKEGILGAILLIMGVFDRLYIDWHWVGRTKAWIIPGTEDLMPCIPAKVHLLKWVYTLVLYPACGALVRWIVNLFL